MPLMFYQRKVLIEKTDTTSFRLLMDYFLVLNGIDDPLIIVIRFHNNDSTSVMFRGASNLKKMTL